MRFIINALLWCENAVLAVVKTAYECACILIDTACWHIEIETRALRMWWQGIKSDWGHADATLRVLVLVWLAFLLFAACAVAGAFLTTVLEGV